uniref:Uncharacterized protein n=1 Tax=Arundo donax TaxID=35708 RepID=A0A0A9C8G4_ARUDO
MLLLSRFSLSHISLSHVKSKQQELLLNLPPSISSRQSRPKSSSTLRRGPSSSAGRAA